MTDGSSFFLLLSIECEQEDEGLGFRAHLPGIPAYGDGETEEEAVRCLIGALTTYLAAFGEDIES